MADILINIFSPNEEFFDVFQFFNLSYYLFTIGDLVFRLPYLNPYISGLKINVSNTGFLFTENPNISMSVLFKNCHDEKWQLFVDSDLTR